MRSTNHETAGRSPPCCNPCSRERPCFTRLKRVYYAGPSSPGIPLTRRKVYIDIRGKSWRSPRIGSHWDSRTARGALFTAPGDFYEARGYSLRAASGDGLGGDGEDLGPVLVPLDPDSEGGLGGTSDDVFGPLVRTRRLHTLL